MKRRQIRKKALRLATFLLSLIILVPAVNLSAGASGNGASAGSSAVTGQRTVRVGIHDADTRDMAGNENNTVTFEKDYLQALAEYASWNFEYVEGSWKDCLEMLKDGRIDIMLDATMTPERQQDYDYSSESMGTEMSYLFGRSDTDLYYDDFAAFDGMTVGYQNGGTIIDSLREYGQEMGFSVREKAYNSGAEMFKALDNGEIDAVAQSSFYDTPPGHVVLAKCNPVPVYIIASKKDPSLRSEIDNAMSQLLSYNPGFNTDLYESHFQHNMSQIAGFTREESDYLNSDPVVNVLYETNWAPFEYLKDGEPAGITPDVIHAIGRATGIDFRFVLSSSTQTIYKDISQKAADEVTAVSYDYIWANSHGLRVTQPYISGSVMQVMKTPGIQPQSVAVVQDGYLASRIVREYPQLKTVPFGTFGECMDAVADGDADCTFLNYYQANYYRSMSEYEEFIYQPVENITQSIGLGVTNESDPVLLGILSKSLQRLSNGELQSILSENSIRTQKLSLGLMIKRYPLQTALVIGAVCVLVSLLIFMIFLSGVRKRQNLALAEAKKEAEEASQAKSEFLLRMSHDIRTPLNGIIGMTNLAGDEAISPQVRDYLTKIDTSSKFLLSLINDILDMTKAESGKIELHQEPYFISDFNDYIDAVIRPLCRSRDQTLETDMQVLPDRVPLLDKLRINQIMFNLLSNAVKYTPEGGRISCSVREQAAGDERMTIELEVSDNGTGMSEKFQGILFTSFAQENRDDNSENRGTGLGLAITKKLVDAMGGTISVNSELGKGSVFTVRLEQDCIAAGEAENSGNAAGQHIHAETGSLAGIRVLLCEDNLINQEIAYALLVKNGMIVEIAGDGQKALDAFSKSPPGYFDAILMDIRMPVMNGYEATEAIRALDRADAATVPIIAMTADAFDDDVKKCLSTGMNAHVAKPIDPQLLYDALLSTTGGRGRPGRITCLQIADDQSHARSFVLY